MVPGLYEKSNCLCFDFVQNVHVRKCSKRFLTFPSLNRIFCTNFAAQKEKQSRVSITVFSMDMFCVSSLLYPAFGEVVLPKSHAVGGFCASDRVDGCPQCLQSNDGSVRIVGIGNLYGYANSLFLSLNP